MVGHGVRGWLSVAGALVALAASGCVAEADGGVGERTSADGSAIQDGDVVQVVSVNSGQVLDIDGISKADGAAAHQWPYLGQANQQWRLHLIGGDLYELVSLNSGKCLDVYGDSTADGGRIVQWTCKGTANQRWTIRAASAGGFEIVGAHSGKCLDVVGVSQQTGALLQQWSCGGGANQRWRLVPVGGGSSGGGTTPGGSSGGGTTPGGGGSGGKKGVGTWWFNGVDRALNDLHTPWFYTWRPGLNGVPQPSGMEFVPMIWDESYVDSGSIAEAKRHGGTLLGFNEPDHTDQSNMSVQQALSLWDRLEATGMRLGSPATAADPSASWSWLEQFMNGTTRNGRKPKVDFLCLHWYGANSDAGASVNELRGFLERAHNKFNLPIWLTEYALISWSGTNANFPPESQQAAFAARSAEMLEGLPYVERYAWFSMSKYTSNGWENTFLYNNDGSVTRVGAAYRDADR